MAGVLLIVNVPQKDFEFELRKKEKTPSILVEQEKKEKTNVLQEFKGKGVGSKAALESYAQYDDASHRQLSTDCLHSDNKKEINQGVIECEKKSYMKLSWEEMRQVIKPKKKLRITPPGSDVDILAAFRWDTPLETILSEIIFRLEIKNASWNATRDNSFWQVTFSLPSGCLCEELLQVLRTFGIGSRHQSSVSVIPCALYYRNDQETVSESDLFGLHSADNSAWSRFSSSVRARTNLAQVLHYVQADAALTFDWLFLLVVAAFVAAIGLVENSTVVLVASMLISPLMGPITASTLGTAVRSRSLQQMGVLHEVVGLMLCLSIGFIFGLAVGVNKPLDDEWPTDEMMTRCEIRSLWVGAMIAIPSGAGVALAVLGDYTASLVGVAISASLLPPAVNAGLLWSMAFVELVTPGERRWLTPSFTSHQAAELAVLGTVSLCLTLVNIVCIFLAGVIVYKVKKVCPMERRDISWWRENNHLMKARPRDSGGDDAVPRELYSKWYNNDLDSPMEHKKKIDNDYLGDTVTFRRPPPAKCRPSAQNFEDYCDQKLSAGLNSSPNIPNKEEIQATDNTSENSVNTDSLASTKTEEADKTYHNGDYSYFNLNFQHDTPNNEDRMKESPTIEPSFSYTIDAKKCGIILDSKSFEV